MSNMTDKYVIRRLEENDYYKGLMELLAQLTTAEPITFLEFQTQFQKIPEVYVIEDQGRIIATGTLLLEPKFIHHCGLVGHIEDIVVDDNYRGKHLGLKLIQHLVEVAEAAKCYKVILDCNETNIPFYERCGFQAKEVEMVLYFN